MIRAFFGFNTANPQHLAWLKRKLANRDRYERRQKRLGAQRGTYHLPRAYRDRRPPAEHNFSRSLARHLQSRKPPFSYWWNKPVAMRRNALSGQPEMKSRLAWWNEVHQEHQKEGGK